MLKEEASEYAKKAKTINGKLQEELQATNKKNKLLREEKVITLQKKNKLLREENELLRKENELIRKENKLIRKENRGHLAEKATLRGLKQDFEGDLSAEKVKGDWDKGDWGKGDWGKGDWGGFGDGEE